MMLAQEEFSYLACSEVFEDSGKSEHYMGKTGGA